MHDTTCLVPNCRHVGDPVQLTVSRVDEGHRTRVLVGGEIDIATAAELRSALELAVRPGITDLVIDLTDVTFMDSSGVRALLLAARGAKALRTEVSLLVPASNTAVGRVLDVLQIGLTIPIVAH